MNIRDTQERIIETVLADHPEAMEIVKRVRAGTQRCKGEISDFQAAALYAIAKGSDGPAAQFLEIGTAYGFSAGVMAKAAPGAHIATLNPQLHEVVKAAQDLRGLGIANVMVSHVLSWDYYEIYDGPRLDLIFVDGDHVNVRRDFVWWNWLKPGGLMLFHDYSPEGTWRACPPVYEALNEVRERSGRDFDVQVIDAEGVGMVGYTRNGDELWPGY